MQFPDFFGCSDEELKTLNCTIDFEYHQAGIMNRYDLPLLFNEVDIFLDCSSFQAMGLTAFEAMACGAAVIVPQNGGCKEVVINEVNGLIVDTESREICEEALNRLIKDVDLRIRIGTEAIKDICKIPAEKAAYNILRALFSDKDMNGEKDDAEYSGLI